MLFSFFILLLLTVWYVSITILQEKMSNPGQVGFAFIVLITTTVYFASLAFNW